MAAGRKSTIHDLTSLRLHHDGSRVPLNPLAPGPSTNTARKIFPFDPKGKTKADLQYHDPDYSEDLLYVSRQLGGLHNRRMKYAVRDARGNWIARDAVGFVDVPRKIKRKKADGDESDEVENIEYEQDEEDEEGVLFRTEDEELEGRARKKRRRIVEKDFSFIGSGAGGPDEGALAAAGSGTNGASLPLPSSDLLKCIHHFASVYYSSQGQLFNASAEEWQERKERAARKLREENEGMTVDSDEEHAEDDEEQTVPNAERGTKTKGKEKKRKRNARRDMYKKFDGTALMAIGMILQEQVAHMLKNSVPSLRRKRDDSESFRDDGEEDEDAHAKEVNEDIESEDDDEVADETEVKEQVIESEDSEDDAS